MLNLRFSKPTESQAQEMEPLSKTGVNEEIENADNRDVSPWILIWDKHFSGWRGGVLFQVVLSIFVLFLNIILAIVAATKWDLEGGIATIFTGSCNKANTILNTLPLLINVLSSLLLGASNYCMQRLVAPTRNEIDVAHAKKKWLDIGMPSIRNLPHIGRGRVALWALLGLSSLPLHLLYNSVIFGAIAASDADFLVVSPEFFTEPESWHLNSGQQNILLNQTYIEQLQGLLLDSQYLDTTKFENLTGSQCNDRYLAPVFIENAGVAFAVLDPEYREGWRSSNGSSSGSLISAASSTGELHNDLDSIVGLNGKFISYCLSQVVKEKCQVQLSLDILLIVIACNVIKIVLLLVMLWRLSHSTIVTIGDAIESFLIKPDPTTVDCCTMSRRKVDMLWVTPEARLNQRWQPPHRRPWFSACSRRRWITSMFLCSATIIVGGALLGVAHTHEGSGRNGLGVQSPDNMIKLNLPWSDSIIPWILMANLPQSVISCIYLTYNGLFTSMLIDREWTRYGIKRAPLRVTLPRPGQRSTLWLSMPFTWGVPILICSILLHYFVSVSIFLIRVAVYQNGVPMPTSEALKTLKYYTYGSYHQSGNIFTGVGYSDVGLVVSICWGIALVVFALLVGGLCTYPTGVPVGGSNSAVISAACHLRLQETEQGEEDIADKSLMWGVTIRGAVDKVGHCCFTDRGVQAPQKDCLYAGISITETK